MKEKLVWSGLAGGIVYWTFVGWSISRNRWFSFWKNALSDLGGNGASSPWIYNAGLIIAGVLVFMFSLALIIIAKNKLQTVGGAYISVSSLFLALIGVFHEGTRPHIFVSTYFFIQFFIGAVIHGLGSDGKMKVCSVAIFLLALAGAFFHWPSTALLETYEVILVMAFTFIAGLSTSVLSR